jgi:hypothetical protein
MNETQIGNKETKKQRENEEKEVSCDEVVGDVLMTITTSRPAHLIYLQLLLATSTIHRKRHSWTHCYSCVSLVWTSMVSWHLE